MSEMKRFEPTSTRWKQLSLSQLMAAHYALRVIHTSPRIRGAALEMVEGLIGDIAAEFKSRPCVLSRPPAKPRAAKRRRPK